MIFDQNQIKIMLSVHIGKARLLIVLYRGQRNELEEHLKTQNKTKRKQKTIKK